MPARDAVIISHLLQRRHFNGGWMHLTLNSGKTRPCFPAESAHYKTVWELPTSKHNSLTSDGSEWRGRELGPSHRGRLKTSPTGTRPVNVSLGHRCMLSSLPLLHPQQVGLQNSEPPQLLCRVVVQRVVVRSVLQLKEQKFVELVDGGTPLHLCSGSHRSVFFQVSVKLTGGATCFSTCLESVDHVGVTIFSCWVHHVKICNLNVEVNKVIRVHSEWHTDAKPVSWYQIQWKSRSKPHMHHYVATDWKSCYRPDFKTTPPLEFHPKIALF